MITEFAGHAVPCSPGIEARGLDIADIDRERRLLRVRQGKGRKDRVVPIGRNAIAWLVRYLVEARPKFIGETPTTVLFLRHGRRSPGSSADAKRSGQRPEGKKCGRAVPLPSTIRYRWLARKVYGKQRCLLMFPRCCPVRSWKLNKG